MIDEEKLRSLSRWRSVADIPGFPFSSFDELKSSISDGTYALDVSYTAARELASVVRSPIGRLINLTLLLAPWLVIVCTIGAAIWLGNYAILLGIPIALICHFVGNPMIPGRDFFGGVIWLAFFTFLLALWQGWQTTEWLLASAVIPFLANREMYRENVDTLNKAVKSSEPLFLYLYEKFGLRIRNTETGEQYWNTLEVA